MTNDCLRWACCAVSCAVLAAGCGGHSYGPTGTISGKLTLEGKPLPAGTAVSFMQMEKGYLAFGLTDANGNFTVESFNKGEMPVGKYNVMIAPAAVPPPKQLSAEEAFDHPDLVDPKAPLEFPKKYRDTTTSGLEYEIKAGKNEFEIDLKNDPRKT